VKLIFTESLDIIIIPNLISKNPKTINLFKELAMVKKYCTEPLVLKKAAKA
jgi:hypothetical protein